jgi:predicted transcriptional regulator
MFKKVLTPSIMRKQNMNIAIFRFQVSPVSNYIIPDPSDKIKTNALSIFQKSCYFKNDFKINQESYVKDVIERFTNSNIGCLAVTNSKDKIIGLVTERDYIHRVAFQNKKDTEVKVKEICTFAPEIIIAKKDDSLELCMEKIMLHDYRHLLVVDDCNNNVMGIISIKDLIRENNKYKNEIITRLSDFSIGKGGFYGSE